MGGALQAFELLPRIGVNFVLRHLKSAGSVSQAFPWYTLVELASQHDDGLTEAALQLAARASADGVVGEAAFAPRGTAQRADFWRLRKSMSEVQKHEGGSIKHDVSVAVKDVPDFIEEASRLVVARIPGARPVPFGHMGDGKYPF